MANKEQMEILRQGSKIWNKWRAENRDVKVELAFADLRGVDLSHVSLYDARLYGADFTGSDLRFANLEKADLERASLANAYLWLTKLNDARMDGVDFRNSNLRAAYLSRANLIVANFTGANLTEAKIVRSDLSGAKLVKADLTNASLLEANLRDADLREANLKGVDLRGASLLGTLVDKAKISDSLVHRINVWDLRGEFEEQKNLVISLSNKPVITVDNIRVAQFIYMILENEEIRGVIDTLTSKSVLILGRFAIPERKEILDALRNKLREYDLLPIVFDFDRPIDRDFTETIKTLAGLSYFVIADVTNPRSSPLELQATVPDYQIPFVPIIQEGESPFAMMVDLQKKYNWVLNTVKYDSMETLIKVLKPLIIDPAMKKRRELRIIKAQEPDIISARDYLKKAGE